MPYFDHNATTFLAPEVAETMASALREVHGNASSIHRPGRLARQHLEKSRRTVAGFLGASAAEIVFTSGGTEANNLAILGMARGHKHVVTTPIEHPSVLESIRQLGREGVDVSVVDVANIEQSLRDDTVLVSVMHANNETGAIQPVREIAALVEQRRAAGQTIYFHSDGVQAAGKIPVDVRELGVDLYSLSAHKLFAPKGVGALYVRKGTPLRGIQFGGRHERERRAGTENVPAAMAFARAIELCDGADVRGLTKLRDDFENDLAKRLPWIEVNGSENERVPNTSSVLFRGITGEALVIALDLQNMAVSTGSACSSGSIEPSHVLLAMGRSREEARSSVRFSFGRYNTVEEMKALVDVTARAAEKLRKEEKRLAG
ncbi:MAG TPA: cysteine desulfurase family protein [Bryobacteraceae bacterium]|nr:cysteine desulfurase family protein [Bryobacteraceae bacterium]